MAIVEAILKLQEHGITAAPHSELALPDRPQAPQIVREPRVVKLPPKEVAQSDATPSLMANGTTPQPDSVVTPEPLVAVVAEVEEEEAEPVEEPLYEDASQDNATLWDGSSLAEADEVYETEADEGEEEEEEPLPLPSTSNLEWWQANWEPFKGFLAKQGEQGQRAMLRLKWGDPIAATADTLTLGFGYTMHLEKVQKPEEKSVIERALGTFVHRPIKLISQQVSRNAPPSAPTKNNRFEAAAADPVVQEALRQGGQILDVFTPKE